MVTGVCMVWGDVEMERTEHSASSRDGSGVTARTNIWFEDSQYQNQSSPSKPTTAAAAAAAAAAAVRSRGRIAPENSEILNVDVARCLQVNTTPVEHSKHIDMAACSSNQRR